MFLTLSCYLSWEEKGVRVCVCLYFLSTVCSLYSITLFCINTTDRLTALCQLSVSSLSARFSDVLIHAHSLPHCAPFTDVYKYQALVLLQSCWHQRKTPVAVNLMLHTFLFQTDDDQRIHRRSLNELPCYSRLLGPSELGGGKKKKKLHRRK